MSSSTLLFHDPVTGKAIPKDKVFARDGNLCFESLQTQNAYYKMLEQGFCVEFEMGKPVLKPGKMERVWELSTSEGNLARLSSRDVLPQSATTCSLVEGRYQFQALAPQLSSSLLAGTNRRKISVKIEVYSRNGSFLVDTAMELTAENSHQKVNFQVSARDAPAVAKFTFHSPSTFNKLMVKASLDKTVASRRVDHEANSAIELAKSTMKPGEFLVELVKDAVGVGMTFKWDSARLGAAVKSIDPVGVASRSKVIKEGDIVRSVQGVRVDGMDFKQIQQHLRNVPMRVVLVMEHAPANWQGFPAAHPVPPPPTRDMVSPPPPPRPTRRASFSTRAPPPPPPPIGVRPPPPPPLPSSSSYRGSTAGAPPPPPVRSNSINSGGAPPPPPRPSSAMQATSSFQEAAAEPPARNTPTAARRPAPPPPVKDSPARGVKRPPPPAIPAAAASPSPPQPVAAAPAPAFVRKPAPSRPTPPPASTASSSEFGPNFEKYVRLKRAGLTREAIESAMAKDGVKQAPPGFFDDLSKPVLARAESSTGLAPPPPPPAAAAAAVAASEPAPPAATGSFGPAYAKYERMKKSGLPEGAILNAMNRDSVAIPPGFFSAEFEATSAAAPIKLSIPKRSSTDAAPTQAAAPEGNSLVDALKGFNRSNLKKREATEEEEEERKSVAAEPINPLMAELQRKAASGLRKRTQEEIEADLEAKRKLEVAEVGKSLFNVALMKKFENAIPRDESDDEDDDDEWEM